MANYRNEKRWTVMPRYRNEARCKLYGDKPTCKNMASFVMLKDRSRSGRPRKTSARDDRALVFIFNRNPLAGSCLFAPTLGRWC